jgi:chromosome segregation ATPase
MMASIAASVEPVNIGVGRIDNVINLDSDANRPGVAPYFGSSGFAAPTVRQAAMLSPNVLVHQSEKYRDESMSLYIQTVEAANQTSAAAYRAEEAYSRIEALEEEAKRNAEISRQSAASAGSILGQVKSIFNQTLKVSQKMQSLAERMVEIENNTKASAEKLENNAVFVQDRLNQTSSISQELESLKLEMESLKARVAMLENATSITQLAFYPKLQPNATNTTSAEG